MDRFKKSKIETPDLMNSFNFYKSKKDRFMANYIICTNHVIIRDCVEIHSIIRSRIPYYCHLSKVLISIIFTMLTK